MRAGWHCFADGPWSLTRNKIVGDGQPLTEGDIIFRAVIPFEEVPSELYQTSVVMWGGPFMDFAHYPLRRGEIYNMAAIFRVPLPEDGSTPKGTAEQLMRRFERACPAVRALVPKLDTSRQWVLYERPAIRDWFKGRVALLGDAAHAGYHYIAQGACMALEDSVVLADVMAESATIEEGFRKYRDGRYLRTGAARRRHRAGETCFTRRFLSALTAISAPAGSPPGPAPPASGSSTPPALRWPRTLRWR